MKSTEPTNLCRTCWKHIECFEKGIFERETCSEYQPMSLDEILEKDEFERAIFVGACPKCDSENTYYCDNPLELTIKDPSVGHCLDCGIYWCLECNYVFDKAKEETRCPHWGICLACSAENGYLTTDEFIEKICHSCEYYSDGCQLEDPSECEKESRFCCPYDGIVSECPEIQEFLKRQP